MDGTTHGLGWVPEHRDVRDYLFDSAEVRPLLEKTAVKALFAKKAAAPALAKSVDLRKWCTPIEDQGSLGSCTANAAVGILEYYQNRAKGAYLDASRLFVYKATRNLMKVKGDTGAYLRTAMKSLVLFGAPPETYWPYKIADFDVEPPAFCYSFGSNFKAVKYYRLDPPSISGSQALKNVKKSLALNQPSMFGFTVYSSIWDAANGEIPYPVSGDRVDGGHAVVAVGYDDAKKIGGKTGALLIRNSWGKGWGLSGYGWLPYAYVEDGLAEDFWSVVSAEWVDTGKF